MKKRQKCPACKKNKLIKGQVLCDKCFKWQDDDLVVTQEEVQRGIKNIMMVEDEASDFTWCGHPMFYEILEEMKLIHHTKNQDYAKTQDPLSNLKMCEEMDMPAWKGGLVRITDKVARLFSFARKESYEVKDENFEDTLIDLANYSVLTLILYREWKNKNKPDTYKINKNGKLNKEKND